MTTARSCTSGVISPWFTEVATVTGSVRMSQTVATASTMLMTATDANRLTLHSFIWSSSGQVSQVGQVRPVDYLLGITTAAALSRTAARVSSRLRLLQ